MKNGYDASLLAVFGAAFLILGLIAGASLFPVHDTKVVTDTQIVYVNKTVPVSSPEVDYLYNQATEEDRQESMAESLFLEEFGSKDFKKEVFNVLNNSAVESYKDLYKFKIKDSDVSLSGDEAEVSVEFKVYYYLDGDEEEIERALFTAVFNVVELDDSENYADSEVEDYSVDLVKIYE